MISILIYSSDLRLSYLLEKKIFPGIKANDKVTLQVVDKEIHALLGENGAGKSTLMSVLFGLYQPEEGFIKVRGKEVEITNPNIANELATDTNFEVGADIKYSITPSLTLDLTYNTDFAQVEVDEQQVNLDRFNLFFSR